MRSVDDWNRLVARCLESRDRAARHELVAAAYAIVAAVMAARADAETAKDLTQDVFVKLVEDDWRRLRAFDPSLSVPFPVYLRVIAVRHAIDWSRSRGQQAESRRVDLAGVAKTLGIAPDVGSRLLLGELEAAVVQLPPQQQLAIRYRLEGQTVQEIARCMGLADGGAAALLWRARGRLRKLLGTDPR